MAGATTPTTFGSKLLAAPNLTFGCDEAPTVNGLVPTGASQCIWSQVTSGSSSVVGSDDIPGGNGTVTSARVRVGAVTGSMSFVMFRALINVDNFNESCCVVLLQSKPFVPTKNAVTNETVNFPIVGNHEIIDGNLAVVDILGLSIHSAKVPVPLINKTTLPINTQPADEALFGTVHPGVAQQFFDPLGFQLNIQGSFVPK